MAEERIQRRLAAILAADVVGYSRLMGEDDAGTRTQFNTHLNELIEPAIVRGGGRVVKITGDGLLVEFASVVDAVRCAAEIQNGMAERNVEEPNDRRMEFRIGVNLGDVIIEGDDIHGDGVNVAARLEGLANPGGIVVSGKVHDEVRGKLDFVFDDIGPQDVKNIAEPVHAYRVRLRSDTSTTSGGSLPLPDKPSIAVLPFDNMSGDPEQEYFSDGITEDIITALARSRWLRVIARNSSFSYKGQSPDIRDVSLDLGARYVLEGSVRKSGDRVRISAQLIDGASGDHLWAERYDRALEDIFAVQDNITATVSAAIEPELAGAERRRSSKKNPANLNAWDLYHQAMAHYFTWEKPSLKRSAQLLEQSLDQDRNFGRAWAALAETLFNQLILNFSDDRSSDAQRMYDAGLQAVRADNDDHTAHESLGRALVGRKEYGRALAEYEKAIALNPFSGKGHYGYGVALLHSGDASRAITEFETAIKLSPRDPYRSGFYARMAYGQILLGDYQSAVEWARKSISEPYTADTVYFFMVSALGHLGRTEETAAALNELLEKVPSANIEQVRQQLPTIPKYLEHLLDGLRKAGLPE